MTDIVFKLQTGNYSLEYAPTESGLWRRKAEEEGGGSSEIDLAPSTVPRDISEQAHVLIESWKRQKEEVMDDLASKTGKSGTRQDS